MCQLERTGNPDVVIDYYPLPLIKDVFNNLSYCTVFCALDLSNALQQLMVSENIQQLLTIIIHKGLYQFTRLCFDIVISRKDEVHCGKIQFYNA